MQYRIDQKSGNSLSALGLGCMRFPMSLGRIDLAKSEKVVLSAIEQGVNYFDTAYIYPGSEEALGTILDRNSMRKKAFIATKLPLASCRKAEDFDKFLSESLSRLKTNYIDYYLLHSASDLKQFNDMSALGLQTWLNAKKKEGIIKSIGFSFHGTRDEFLSLLDAYPWDFCQIQYNYSDPNYQAGVTGLKKAAELGMPVIIMEPLLGGKLVGGLPKKAVELFANADSNITPAGWALDWLWDQPETTVVLSGMNTVEQIQENCALASKSAPGMLTPENREIYVQVNKLFQESYKIHCTGCGYCMPCPKNVNIPGCFAAYNTSYVMGFVTGIQQYATSTNIISDRKSTAGLCVECGKCESHCPQKLQIRQELKKVERRLEPWPVKAALAVAKRVMK
ncbi:MAG: aldo/keto reductase [Clostridiales bacterium]|nr:aldo/keto reductase [Clostridiales bacterium]